jgi:hypothetical protein
MLEQAEVEPIAPMASPSPAGLDAVDAAGPEGTAGGDSRRLVLVAEREARRAAKRREKVAYTKAGLSLRLISLSLIDLRTLDDSR